MKVIVDLCVVPIGVGVSVSEYVTACERVLRKAGLKTFMHAYGTNIEGEWEEVFEAVRQCHEEVHEMGVPRISTTIRLGTRTDRAQTMEEKIESVERKLRDETSAASSRPVHLMWPKSRRMRFTCISGSGPFAMLRMFCSILSRVTALHTAVVTPSVKTTNR